MSYIYGQARTQSTIFALEDLIASDNEVRLVDMLVDKLYLEDSSKFTLKGKSYTGRPAYHPVAMLKLFMYGYLNRISSSRRLAKECSRNIELMWLINSLTPDFKTIADFRKDNAEAIKELSLKFKYMLCNQGLISGELMAIDGTKLKANAGGKELTYDDLTATLKDLEHEINRYFELLRNNDQKEEMADEESDDLSNAELIAAQIQELQARQEKLQKLQSIAEQDKRKKVNPTDPESRMMKGRKESFDGYNLQIVVDSLFKLVASAQVKQTANDLQEMIPALEHLEESLGLVPGTMVADNGYENVADLQELEAKGKTEVLVMGKDEKDGAKGFKKSNFTYDEAQDCYYCPLGNKLSLRGGTQKRKERFAYVYHCSQSVCRACKHKAKCSKSKQGRTITRYTDENWVEAYRNRMQNPREKALLRRRKAIVEHVFGVLKCWMGKIPLLLRGQAKVQTEIELYTTSYNLKRLIKLFGFDGVKNMIMSVTVPKEGFLSLFLALFLPKSRKRIKYPGCLGLCYAS